MSMYGLLFRYEDHSLSNQIKFMYVLLGSASNMYGSEDQVLVQEYVAMYLFRSLLSRHPGPRHFNKMRTAEQRTAVRKKTLFHLKLHGNLF